MPKSEALWVALMLILVLAGCDSAPSGPSFSREIVPLLKRHCVMCHMDGGAQGELSLHPQPYAALLGRASTQSDMLLVVPGDAQASYLYHKLLGSHLQAGGNGQSMPYQRDLLAAKDIEAVAQWISHGAQDN